MNGADVLKSYLVALGFDINMSDYNKFKNALNDAEKRIEQHTEGMSKSYIKATAVVTSALASIGFATVGLLDKIANADLEYKKFAMHMFIGRDAAKAMKIATDALGESLEDIAWMPELRKRYFALTRQARGMETPKGDQDQLRKIRDIQFEFQRLKVEITYGMQWIGHYLFKYLEGPLKSVKETLRGMNDWIQAKMPEWSERIAYGLSAVIGVITSVVHFIKDIFAGFKSIWDIMPEWSKKVAIGLAVAFAPVSPFIKIMSALILLIDDFYAYIDGRKSSKTLAPIWGYLTKAVDYIVRGLVASAVLVDDIFNKKNMSWKDIKADMEGAWSDVEGVKDANGIKKMGAAAATGMKNYQNMTGFSYRDAINSGVSSSSTVTTIEVGKVDINIAGTQATPKEIFESVKLGIQSAGARMAINTRQVARP